jgi:hypothetical protein
MACWIVDKLTDLTTKSSEIRFPTGRNGRHRTEALEPEARVYIDRSYTRRTPGVDFYAFPVLQGTEQKDEPGTLNDRVTFIIHAVVTALADSRRAKKSYFFTTSVRLPNHFSSSSAQDYSYYASPIIAMAGGPAGGVSNISDRSIRQAWLARCAAAVISSSCRACTCKQGRHNTATRTCSRRTADMVQTEKPPRMSENKKMARQITVARRNPIRPLTVPDGILTAFLCGSSNPVLYRVANAWRRVNESIDRG